MFNIHLDVIKVMPLIIHSLACVIVSLCHIKHNRFSVNRTNFLTGPEADSVLNTYLSLETAAGTDVVALEDVRKSFTLRMLALAKGLPGVAGIHVMPVTRKGWRDLGALVEGGQV